MSSQFEKFKARHEITRVAEATKMIVVYIMILSILMFSIIGKENVKQIIWYWVTFMTLLVIICIIQDISNKIKIKRLGL